MTNKIMAQKSANHLIEEKSPYLLQHAHNPVDWYPWGEEAFVKAREEDKPIFLSIGYSTCHWCHVMAHESFENEKIAALINKYFIPVKVDREERPDIDEIYMKVCQLLTGSGGWPLSIFLTPDRKPFFAATYIPRESKSGRKGMKDLIPEIGELWQNQKEKALESAGKITSILQNESEDKKIQVQRAGENQPDNTLLENAYHQLESSFDNKYGGFGTAPKFPVPHKLLFLIRYWNRTEEEYALNMVEETLQAMRSGGIYDQLGSGFHRYSTDRKWLLPHFEKMLYDNALLTYLYTEVYQATANSIYSRTACEIISYLIGEMQSPEGGFYSAEDADSEGEEGKFYVWSEEDIKEILSADEADAVIDLYHIKKEGNFTEERSGKQMGRNILYVDDIVHNLDKIDQLQEAREKLLRARDERIHPHKDDKILTDWNGLTVAALAKAGWTFNDKSYIEAAEKVVNFISENLINEQGRLLHRYREGEASITANLDDYSFLIWGLIELYQASFKTRYLELALRLNNQQQEYFQDEKGGYFFTPDDGEDLLIRPKNIYDGALPSGNSIALWNLVRLAHLTGDQSLEDEAAAIYNNFYSGIKNNPASHCQLLTGIDCLINTFYDIVIAGEKQDNLTVSMFNNIGQNYIPGKVIIFYPQPSDNVQNNKIEELAPFIREYKMINNQTTAYICKDYSCQLPVNDVEEMLTLLDVD